MKNVLDGIIVNERSELRGTRQSDLGIGLEMICRL